MKFQSPETKIILLFDKTVIFFKKKMYIISVKYVSKMELETVIFEQLQEPNN